MSELNTPTNTQATLHITNDHLSQQLSIYISITISDMYTQGGPKIEAYTEKYQ